MSPPTRAVLHCAQHHRPHDHSVPCHRRARRPRRPGGHRARCPIFFFPQRRRCEDRAAPSGPLGDTGAARAALSDLRRADARRAPRAPFAVVAEGPEDSEGDDGDDAGDGEGPVGTGGGGGGGGGDDDEGDATTPALVRMQRRNTLDVDGFGIVGAVGKTGSPQTPN